MHLRWNNKSFKNETKRINSEHLDKESIRAYL